MYRITQNFTGINFDGYILNPQIFDRWAFICHFAPVTCKSNEKFDGFNFDCQVEQCQMPPSKFCAIPYGIC